MYKCNFFMVLANNNNPGSSNVALANIRKLLTCLYLYIHVRVFNILKLKKKA